jgi:purine-binding chemotaxis protein CheW
MRGERELVSMTVARQLVGIPVAVVRDVLGPLRMTRVPRAPAAIAGVLNLRGRIVTAIDLSTRLGLAREKPADEAMSVVVENGSELYSLLVDGIGEVLRLPLERFDPEIGSLGAAWRELASGVHQRDEGLLIELDVARILRLPLAA